MASGDLVRLRSTKDIAELVDAETSKIMARDLRFQPCTTLALYFLAVLVRTTRCLVFPILIAGHGSLALSDTREFAFVTRPPTVTAACGLWSVTLTERLPFAYSMSLRSLLIRDLPTFRELFLVYLKTWPIPTAGMTDIKRWIQKKHAANWPPTAVLWSPYIMLVGPTPYIVRSVVVVNSYRSYSSRRGRIKILFSP